MLPDPLPLQDASGDVSYGVVSFLGTKSIRTRAAQATDELESTLTISHDTNEKTNRKRSVLRVDVKYNLESAEIVEPVETCAVYLVLDRPSVSNIDTGAGHVRRAIAQVLSFFATDPAAATPGSIPYAITTSNANKLIAGEP